MISAMFQVRRQRSCRASQDKDVSARYPGACGTARKQPGCLLFLRRRAGLKGARLKYFCHVRCIHDEFISPVLLGLGLSPIVPYYCYYCASAVVPAGATSTYINAIIIASTLQEYYLGQVIIRNLEDEVIERLKAKAAAQNQSLEQALRDIVSASVKPTRSEVLQEMHRIRRMTPTKLTTDSADLISEARAER